MRTFLALDVSEDVRKNIGELIALLEPQARGVRWTRPENLHVTFKFFGEIDSEQRQEEVKKIIALATAKAKKTELVCAGLGAFPRWEMARVIWADLTGETGELKTLQKEMETAFVPLGFPAEGRDFTLHLTLARIKSDPRKQPWVETLRKIPAREYGRFTADHLTLYKSQLTKTGPVYTALQTFPFGG